MEKVPIVERTDRWLAIFLGGNQQTGMMRLVVYIAGLAVIVTYLGSVIR